MDRSDLELARLLLDYLRKWAVSESKYKFNVIGRYDQRGELELNANIDLSPGERKSLLWIWKRFEDQRLIETAHGDGWVTLADNAKELSDDTLSEILTSRNRASDTTIVPITIVNSSSERSPQSSSSSTAKHLDALTGLAGRGEYDVTLNAQANLATDEKPLSLIVIDIDNFKHFNDTFGHSVGDAVLRQVAAGAAKIVDGKGYAFRYGGEEIVVLAPNYSLPESTALAERIRGAIEALTIEGVESNVTASLGVAAMPETAPNSRELFEQADNAMYESKKNGKNQVTSATAAAMSASRSPARTKHSQGKPRIRVRLLQGHRQLYMLEVSNSGHSDIEVEQIELTHDGINLMTPERPQTESDWTVPSGGVKTISWKPEPDPAASLMRMRPGLGIIMQIPVEFTLTLKSGPSTHEYRQKLAVHVLGTNGEVTQIAG